MARVFSISKGQDGFECRVSTQEFEQNKAMVCNVAAPAEVTMDVAPAAPAPAQP